MGIYPQTKMVTWNGKPLEIRGQNMGLSRNVFQMSVEIGPGAIKEIFHRAFDYLNAMLNVNLVEIEVFLNKKI
jgi:hypothetical protein